MSAEEERISKRIARAGICSRRDAERLIAAGRVAVNGQTLTSPAFNVTQNDVISVDGDVIGDDIIDDPVIGCVKFIADLNALHMRA